MINRKTLCKSHRWKTALCGGGGRRCGLSLALLQRLGANYLEAVERFRVVFLVDVAAEVVLAARRVDALVVRLRQPADHDLRRHTHAQ